MRYHDEWEESSLPRQGNSASPANNSQDHRGRLLQNAEAAGDSVSYTPKRNHGSTYRGS